MQSTGHFSASCWASHKKTDCNNHVKSSAEAKMFFFGIKVEKYYSNITELYYGSFHISFQKWNLSVGFSISDYDQHRHKNVFGGKLKYVFFTSCHFCVCILQKLSFWGISWLKLLQKKNYVKWGCINMIWTIQKYLKNQCKSKK